MSEEEYQRLRNLLNTVVEQQAIFAENQLKAEARMTRVEANMTRAEARMTRGDARMTRCEESIAALLAIAEMHEQEAAETTQRINALVNVVERYISKDQQ